MYEYLESILPEITSTFAAFLKVNVFDWWNALFFYRTSEAMKLNKAWRNIFCKRNKIIGNIPSTQSALVQYVYKFSAEYIWGQALNLL